MASVETEPLYQPFESVTRLFTVEDLEELPTDLPSGPIDFELDNGRLVFVMVPPGNIHGATQVNVATQLKIQGDFRGHGKTWTEVGVILWRNPDRVVTPDVAFVAARALPIKESREGYLETIPDLVVEIRSKNDSIRYVERKVKHYLQAGVQVVWVADPTPKTVTVHTVASQPVVHHEHDALSLAGLIPDFALTVANVFND
ncbi:MAG: Uma2 family endonuclease [Pirellulales bacterium]